MKRPMTDDWESVEVEYTSRHIFAMLMDIGHGEPGFVGAVLTLTLGRLLARLDDDLANKCVELHTSRALAFRKMLRRASDEKPH